MELVTVKKRVLRFSLHRPSDAAMISDTLDVTNVTADYVAFKVKTTNQERYIVRPNVNTIPPHATVSIFIGVQPATDLPDPGPSKDKFLLRVLQSPDQPDLPPTFWTTHETHPDVQGLKFKVEFDPAPTSAVSAPDNADPSAAAAAAAAAATASPDKIAPAPPGLQTELAAPLASSTAADQSSPVAALTPPAVARPLAVPDLKAPAPPGPALLSESRPRVDFNASSPARPHARDMPPHVGMAIPDGPFAAESSMSPTSSVRAAAAAAASAGPMQETLSDADALLEDERYVDAMERVARLQDQLDERNLELARLKAELLETRAKTARVLKDAPTAPFAVNKIVSDPFGGASLAAVGLMLLLFAVMISFMFRR